MNEDEFIIIDKCNTKNINDFSSESNDIFIKQYKGNNCDNIIIKKQNLQLKLSYYKLNGIFFVNINGENLFDFKTLLLIDSVKCIVENDISIIIIKNSSLGEIRIKNCDLEIFQKAIHFLNTWVKKNKNYIRDLLNALF